MILGKKTFEPFVKTTRCFCYPRHVIEEANSVRDRTMSWLEKNNTNVIKMNTEDFWRGDIYVKEGKITVWYCN